MSDKWEYKIFRELLIGGLLLLYVFILDCERIDVIRKLKIETGSIADLTPNSVSFSGEFLDFGNDRIIEYGICLAKDRVPTVNDIKSIAGELPVKYSFTVNIDGLIPDKTYYAKAYVATSDTIIYGNSIVFLTPGIRVPSVTTNQVLEITSNSAICGGIVTDDGQGEVTARGVCWGIDQNPTIRDSKTSDGTGMGSYTSELTGLDPGTMFYVRAYATNKSGTTYGETKTFSTIISE